MNQTVSAYRKSDETPEPGIPFQVDDMLVLEPRGEDAKDSFLNKWHGLRVKVLNAESPFFQPLDERPDGFGFDAFTWTADAFRHFDPERDFRVGDRVCCTATSGGGYDSEGVILDPSSKSDWTGDVLVDYHTGPLSKWDEPLGTGVDSLTLLPSISTEPEHEDFDFEAGQEIGSIDVLNELPAGTVLVNVTDDESPSVVLYYGLIARLNRFGRSWTSGERLRWCDPIDARHEIEGALSDGVPVVIAYVPGQLGA